MKYKNNNEEQVNKTFEIQTDLEDFSNKTNHDWSAYNKSQTKEKALFINLLGNLCDLIVDTRHSVGRKPRPLKDIIFALVAKEYLNTSSRRVQSDLQLFREAGFLKTNIHFNTLLGHLERIDVRDALKELIEISALPLKQIEQDFAIDATGFGISRYETFFNMKHKGRGRWKQYRKCHAVCGVKTNIITSVEITEGKASDQTQFIPLAKNTKRNFEIRDFCADKGYLSSQNFKCIREMGGQAYIPFKKNSTGKCAARDRSYFKSAYKFFRQHREEYLNHYHKRSNIESAFSMIKRRFGNNVRCKKEISQDNEILARVLAHNLCVLVQEMFLNNVDVDFNLCASQYVAQK